MRLSLGITPKSYFSLAAANDADAQAFIDAAGITDATQKSAVNQLVLDLKSANIWTKMKAIYPIVGGSASTHKWNLKDPRDLDVAYRLGFATGFTHSSTGMLPNGTSAYANTYIKPSIVLSLNSTHICSYIRNSSQGVLLGLDTLPLGSNGRLWISPNFNGTNRYLEINTNAATALTPISSNIGLWLGSRTSSTVSKLYNNNTINYTSSASSNVLDTKDIIIGARNTDPTTSNYSSSQIAFASIGDGLTDTDASNLYTAVQNYNTTLGRQV